jgi:hypothetical protein
MAAHAISFLIPLRQFRCAFLPERRFVGRCHDAVSRRRLFDLIAMGGRMKLKFSTKEVFILIAVSLTSLLANLPESYGSVLFSRKFLLGTLVAIIIIAMFRYLQLLLLLIISILTIGANLPRELAENLNVSQTAAMAVLGLLVGLTLLNRVFRLMPTHAGEQLETPDEAEVDPATLDTVSACQHMLFSIARGDINTVRKLIENGTEAHFFANGTTPLHLATEKGYSSIVKLLIENGANLLAHNANGQTPLDLALTIKKHTKTTNILYDATIPLLTADSGMAAGTPLAM